MDNFFEILIYLIIIISFLSGIFKKRKKTKTTLDKRSGEIRPDIFRTEETSEPEIAVTQQRTKSEYEIMKEIEDFFKVGEGQLESVPEKSESLETISYDEKQMQDKSWESTPSTIEHTADESWHTPTSSEHTYTNFSRKQSAKVEKVVEQNVSKVDSKIEEQAATFEKRLEKSKPAAIEISKKIKERLKNPAALKDYIIISEIMNKPKALRR